MNEFTGARVVLWTARQTELAHVGVVLERRGCEVRTLNTLEQLRRELEQGGLDLIVTQACPCCAEWKILLSESGFTKKLPPVILVADASDVEIYLEGMRRGAFDCVGLPVEETELVRVASLALETRGWREQVPEGVH